MFTTLMVAATAIACGAQAPSNPSTTVPTFIVNGEIKLAYSIDMPVGAGPFPAIVMAHGSGRVTRHDQGYFAREWLNLGFAVLRYDKRGVGESTGVYSGVGIANGERDDRRLGERRRGGGVRCALEIEPERGLSDVRLPGAIPQREDRENQEEEQ